MATPQWVSISKIFCWCDPSSELARFSVTTIAWVLLRRPTVQLPCFTASIAYSNWNSRPCGLHVVL